MKKLIVILFAAGMIAACGEGAKNRTSGANEDPGIEESEVATPQPEDSVDQMSVDTLGIDSIR